MPTLLLLNGFQFIIRTKDHTPPHVHVFYGDEEVLFNLGIDGSAPTLRENRGMSRPNIKRAFRILVPHNDGFLARWREIYN